VLGDAVGPCPVVGFADGTPSRTPSPDEDPAAGAGRPCRGGRSPRAKSHRSLAIGPLAC